MAEYYRVILKKDENGLMFSEIFKQEVEQEVFITMNWDKPIIHTSDGKNLHFLSLHEDYLSSFVLGLIVSANYKKWIK